MGRKRSLNSFKVSRESLTEYPAQKKTGKGNKSKGKKKETDPVIPSLFPREIATAAEKSNWISESIDFPLFACTDSQDDTSCCYSDMKAETRRFTCYIAPIPASCYFYSMSQYNAGQLQNICHLLDLLALPLGPSRDSILYQLNHDSRPEDAVLDMRFYRPFTPDEAREMCMQPLRPIQIYFYKTMAVDTFTIGHCQIYFLNQLGLALDILDCQGATGLRLYLRYLLYIPRQGVSLLEPPHPYPPVDYQVPLQELPPAIVLNADYGYLQ